MADDKPKPSWPVQMHCSALGLGRALRHTMSFGKNFAEKKSAALTLLQSALEEGRASPEDTPTALLDHL